MGDGRRTQLERTGALWLSPGSDGKAEVSPYRCPCCGFLTLDERGSFDICPVCFWEDDGQDDHDADQVRGGPNGRLSLTEARQNFQAMGACDERCAAFVRDPLPHEHPAV
ncbi:CPCC family cysteine-rich protein [Streptomyces sp. NBC_00250]|uniref:CPCC family cysteine-rich protein n=1 Tax=Streptomyces sp. NBC_00250 TaxID=2903641 RepID=UPI002E28426A|nr:CPCC family cysteine-rich protein [Streptomyces sp. NBC_00250]